MSTSNENRATANFLEGLYGPRTAQGRPQWHVVVLPRTPCSLCHRLSSPAMPALRVAIQGWLSVGKYSEVL